jgi:hypothetical protein
VKAGKLVLTAVLGTLFLLAVGAGHAAAKQPKRCNSAASLCSRPFNRVVMAGAHNAMSAESLGWKIPNQSIAIPDQLDSGIRALLIDTHYGSLQPDGTVKTDDDGSVTSGVRGLYLCHEVCEIGASPLVPVLRSIRKFLRQHPDNVLTIINEDYITPQDFASAMKQSGLVDYAYSGKPGPKWPSLQRMIRSQGQVVVLAEHDAGTAYPWYHLAYDGIVQETPYTFNDPSLLTDPTNWPASCVPNRGGTTGSVFLMNHWSPPVPPQQPDPAASEAVNAQNVIVGRARECAAERGQLPTIIATDQSFAGGLFAAVDELNGVRRPD